MKKNLKIPAVFMIYLTLTLLVFQGASAAVLHSTGDLAFGVELMTVPGVGGMDYPVQLSYSGGGGIDTSATADWVGLGWSLDVGSISRSVQSLPDDMHSDTNWPMVYQFYDEDFECTASGLKCWWNEYGAILVAIVVVVIMVVLAILSGGLTIPGFAVPAGLTISVPTAFVLGVAVQIIATLIVNGGSLSSSDWKNIGASVGISLITLGVFDAIQSLEKVTALLKLAVSGYGLYSGSDSLKSSMGALHGARYSDQNVYSIAGYDDTSPDGSLYDFDFQEVYAHTNLMMHDGGAPDSWSISGGPAGSLIIADKQTFGRPSGISDSKFFLSKTTGLEVVDIEFFTNYGDQCPPGVVPCGKFDSNIDMFVVTMVDGTKYVYGNPNIEGSIERIHGSGSYSYSHMQSGDYLSEMWTYMYILNHYPTSWKLTAILAPNYIDGGGDDEYDPVDSEFLADGVTLNPAQKGQWIAFRYDLVHTYESTDTEIGNCGYNYGGSIDGELESYVGGLGIISGGFKDVSYLQSIITPLYQADFEISERLDGAEVQPWEANSFSGISGIKSPYTYDFTTATFKTITIGVSTYNALACSALYSDMLYKLESITLKSRENNEVMQVVKFNPGIESLDDYSQSDYYFLKPGTSGGAYVSDGSNYLYDHAVYSLNSVQLCGADNVCQNPYIFEYTDPSCTPQCQFKECGDDGCGGVCGETPDNYVCTEGSLICDPVCNDNNACGLNQCGGQCVNGNPTDICGGSVPITIYCAYQGLLGQCASDVNCDVVSTVCIPASSSPNKIYCEDINDACIDLDIGFFCDWEPLNACGGDAPVCLYDDSYTDNGDQSGTCVECAVNDDCSYGVPCGIETNTCGECVPNCDGKFCGSDGCGGFCDNENSVSENICAYDEYCISEIGCVECTSTSNNCPLTNGFCNANNQCDCIPSSCNADWCENSHSDGCGGTLVCGDCGVNEICLTGTCYEEDDDRGDGY
jgi:hypothetical protein